MEPADTEQTVAQQPPERAAPAVPAPAPTPRRGSLVLAWLAILVAIALAALGWYDGRMRIDATQAQVAHRLRDVETQARAAQAMAEQAQESVRESQAKLARMDSRLGELQSQKQALESLYQDLSRNRDEVQLAEIEQVLTIASQQLQLSGNVHAALLALQFADRRLARADRPQLLPIRRALAHDIERLTAAPALDLPGLSAKIDALVESVDGLPLAFDERTVPAPAGAGPTGVEAESFLARLGAQVWGELRKLVVLRKVESPAPPLLPPSQSYFLRENLRLRLLNARLSLLMRDEAGYRGDLQAAQTWVKRYFDLHSRRTEGALAQLERLSSISLDIEVPDISGSLEALRSLKARRESGS